MHLKKSKTSVRKLFWALFVVGCGFNVHGVDSSTGTSTTDGAERLNTFVRPTSVEQANKMLEAAAWNGDEDVFDRLLNLRGNIEVTSEALRDAVGGAIWRGHEGIISRVIRVKDHPVVTEGVVIGAFSAALNRKDRMNIVNQIVDHLQVHPQGVDMIFESAAKNDLFDILDQRDQVNVPITRFFAREYGPDFTTEEYDVACIKVLSKVSHIMEKDMQGNIPDGLSACLDQRHLHPVVVMGLAQSRQEGEKDPALLTRLLERFVAGKKGISREMAERLVPQNAYDAATPMIKLRDQGATGLSALRKDVFRAVVEFALPRNDTDIHDEDTRRLVYKTLYPESYERIFNNQD